METLLVSSVSTAENTMHIPEIEEANMAADNSFSYGDLPEDDYGCLVREIAICTYTDHKGNYKLFAKPINVQLWHLEDQRIYVAYNRYFNHFDTGNTPSQSIQNFIRSFIRVYLGYKKTPSNSLTDDAKELLKKFKEHIGTFSNGTR